MIYTISILAVALIVLATVTYRLICRVQELDTRVRNGSDLQTDRLQSVVDQVNGKLETVKEKHNSFVDYTTKGLEAVDELKVTVNGKLEIIKEKHNSFVDFTWKELEAVDELKDTVKAEIPRLVAIQRTAENAERGVYAILNRRDVDNVKEVKQ